MKVYILSKLSDIVGDGIESNIICATADKSIAEQAYNNACAEAFDDSDIEQLADEDEINDSVRTYEGSHTNEDGITVIEKSYTISFDDYYVQVKLEEKELLDNNNR